MTRLSRALIRALLLTTLAALLISALFVGASWWALRSDRGTLQLMSWLPGLEVTQAKGSIWGDFQAERLTYTWPNGSTLVVVAPRWQGLSVVRTDQAAWRLGLSIRSLQAQSADLQWRASATSGPLKVPASLALIFWAFLGVEIVEEEEAPVLVVVDHSVGALGRAAGVAEPGRGQGRLDQDRAGDVALDRNPVEPPPQPDHHRPDAAIPHDQVRPYPHRKDRNRRVQGAQKRCKIGLIGGLIKPIRRTSDPKPGQVGQRTVWRQHAACFWKLAHGPVSAAVLRPAQAPRRSFSRA